MNGKAFTTPNLKSFACWNFLISKELWCLYIYIYIYIYINSTRACIDLKFLFLCLDWYLDERVLSVRVPLRYSLFKFDLTNWKLSLSLLSFLLQLHITIIIIQLLRSQFLVYYFTFPSVSIPWLSVSCFTSWGLFSLHDVRYHPSLSIN